MVVAANQSQRPNGGHDGKHRRGQRGDCIGRLPDHHIVRVAMDRAVTVGHRQRLTQGVDS